MGGSVQLPQPVHPGFAGRPDGLTLSVVILGGLGSVTGAFAAGLLIGLAESVTTTYISVRWAEAVPTILILGVLLIRPQGLFTRVGRQDVAT